VLIRRVYTALWWAALPLLPVRLWWRGRREPGYRAHVAERFGRYAPRPQGEVVWVHAVSLGETRAAAPLVQRILDERPQATVLLTHMTATGRESGAQWRTPRVVQAWLPYDVPFAVERFLSHFQPRAGLLMETEVWPNLLAAARRRAIPVYLVNARLSERSARRYARVAQFSRATFADLAGVAAQGPDDAQRLRALGARDVVVTGSIKFDVDVPAGTREAGARLRARIGDGRPVLVAASTREGEEAQLLDALAAAPAALPDRTVLVIVPRHPQRFDGVAALLDARGIPYVRRTAGPDALPAGTAVVLGDSMGELLAYYAAADVAFVGGSLLPLGGQNPIEPLAVAVPTLFGPHTFNFADVTAEAIAAGAAVRVSDATDMLQAAGRLLRDPAARQVMRERAETFVAAHRGATDRLWAWLGAAMTAPGPSDAARRP